MRAVVSVVADNRKVCFVASLLVDAGKDSSKWWPIEDVQMNEKRMHASNIVAQ